MFIRPDHINLQYSGRIDFEEVQAPVFIYPCSYVKMKFTGNTLRVIVRNQRECWDNYLGYILDGEQGKELLAPEGREVITLPVKEQREVHELCLFKRQDSCHVFQFFGFEIEDTAEIFPVEEKPARRIEVYGDSVSAGEVSEAVAYMGKEDPEHSGEYSNSWYSYSWMTARKLNAQIHNIAQGGIALLDGTGWFCAPEYVGLESTYDKLEYHPHLGAVKEWDFQQYTPHVVIVAIGQNDNHPQDYMAEDPTGEKAQYWKERYERFVKNLREKYPQAVIILTTTILNHAKEWDDAIEEVWSRCKDPKIHHFMYTKNGKGTPGHIRIAEAEKMAEELSGFIESLGSAIWD